MRWQGWIVTSATLLGGLGVAVGAWGYFATATGAAVPGDFEVWQTLRPGEDWQTFWSYRDGLRYYGGALLLLTVVLALLHYVAVGPDRVPASGRMVERYRGSEVLMHAALALSFLVLLASGLYLLWGRFVVGGPAPFWGRLASAAHIWGGLLFLVAVVVMWFQWRRDMRLVADDREWLRRAGGYLSRAHVRLPAGRFNAGQKIWFRAALVLGMVLGLTGLLLYYPGGLGLTPRVQWVLFAVHSAGAVVLISGLLLHLYVATAANPGSFTAMVTGRMDENLAREHYPGMMPIWGGANTGDENQVQGEDLGPGA
ncbi:MAG: formate dehydrogenase subunit gamma [Dehalococcoidia bacterium]